MALLNGSLPSLINGVSQQNPTQRLTSQAEVQDNAYSSITDGVGKRAPTEHLGRIVEIADRDAKVHFIDRDASEKYVLLVQNSKPYFNSLLTGLQYPVVLGVSDFSYLSCQSPREDLRMVTQGDTTFVLNRSLVADLRTADTSVTPPFQAVLWIKSVAYSMTYKLNLDGTTHTVTVPASDPDWAKTDRVASEFRSLIANSASAATWQVDRRDGDSLVWIRRKRVQGSTTLTDSQMRFTVEVSDSGNNKNSAVFTESVQRFTDLPNIAPSGMVMLVAGDVEEGSDDYYVRFQPSRSTATFGPGIWIETIKPGQLYQINPNTMPHRFDRLQDTDGSVTGRTGQLYFRFSRCAWSPRIVGDINTSPTPSFIGQKINDIFFHRNRLGLLAGLNVILSQSGDFLNFWRDTVLTVLDTDPIDVLAAEALSPLNYALPYAEQLLLFANKQQLLLSGGDALTPTSVSVLSTASYECSSDCRPVNIGSSVLVPFNQGEYTGVRELYVDSQSAQKQAVDTTDPVPRYIPKGVFLIAASATENAAVALSRTERDRLWTYKWFYNGAEKVQSSWSRWSFDAQSAVLGVEFIGPVLYAVITRDCGAYIERIVLNKLEDPAQPYVTLLDRRITDAQLLGVVYDAGTNTTLLTMPYPVDGTIAVATRADEEDEDYIYGSALPVVGGSQSNTDCATDGSDDLDPEGTIPAPGDPDITLYAHAINCATGATSDVLLPAILAPLNFMFEGVCYRINPDRFLTRDTAGKTIATDVTLTGGCVDPRCFAGNSTPFTTPCDLTCTAHVITARWFGPAGSELDPDDPDYVAPFLPADCYNRDWVLTWNESANAWKSSYEHPLGGGSEWSFEMEFNAGTGVCSIGVTGRFNAGSDGGSLSQHNVGAPGPAITACPVVGDAVTLSEGDRFEIVSIP